MEDSDLKTHRLCIDEFSSLSPQSDFREFSGETAENERKFSSRRLRKLCFRLYAAHQIFIVGKQKDFIGEYFLFASLRKLSHEFI